MIPSTSPEYERYAKRKQTEWQKQMELEDNQAFIEAMQGHKSIGRAHRRAHCKGKAGKQAKKGKRIN